LVDCVCRLYSLSWEAESELMRMERVYAVTSQRVSSLLQQLSGGSVDEDNTGD